MEQHLEQAPEAQEPYRLKSTGFRFELTELSDNEMLNIIDGRDCQSVLSMTKIGTNGRKV